MRSLRIDVWSDIACPWCYVGKRRLDAALARFPDADSVAVRFRSFELNPAAPTVEASPLSYAERLAVKYGTSTNEAGLMIRRMVDVGAADGIAFDFDKIRPGNTFDAHRLLHFAAEHGAQERLNERLFRGYLSEGLAIGQRTVLANLAVEAGLDLEQVAAVLAGSEFADRVRADEEQAREYGIHGVPFFVLAGHYGVSGAQSADTLLDALQRAWQEREEGRESEGGATCGSDGCAQ